MKTIPENKWKWFGSAGHLCVSEYCRFHLATQIGQYLVSTVGDYYPHGKQSEKPETVGCGRTFETMVFKIDGPCECGCGMPKIIPEELVCDGYNDRASANKGHDFICHKVAKGKL